MTPLKVLSKLFEARDQVHLIHLNTQSYAEHKALNEFYEAWLDLLDSFTETYQGKYGRIEGSIDIEIQTGIESKDYLVQLMIFLNADIPTLYTGVIDSDLDNIVAEMKGLINRTLYKLTLK
jgi:hypothetical protein